MAELNQNFELFQGDTKDLEITVEDGEGNPLDLTGSTIEWRLFRTIRDAVLIEKTLAGGGIEITNEPGGVFVVHLSSEDTRDLNGKFQHEASVTDVRGYTATILTGFVTARPIHG